MTNIGVIALQMAIAEAATRETNCKFGHALQLTEMVFNKHLADQPSTHTAHMMLLETIDAINDGEAITVIPAKGTT